MGFCTLQGTADCGDAAEAFVSCANLRGTIVAKVATGLCVLAIEVSSRVVNCNNERNERENPKCTTQRRGWDALRPGPRRLPAQPGLFP